MPALDEDILRDLMHRCTDDLHAPPGVAAGIVTRHRRRRNTRALSVATVGVAAGTAVALVASGSGGGYRAPTMPALKLTAAQHALDQLSTVAASAPQPTGRYVVLAEKQGSTRSGSRSCKPCRSRR
jgi:hypothetical protein